MYFNFMRLVNQWYGSHDDNSTPYLSFQWSQLANLVACEPDNTFNNLTRTLVLKKDTGSLKSRQMADNNIFSRGIKSVLRKWFGKQIKEAIVIYINHQTINLKQYTSTPLKCYMWNLYYWQIYTFRLASQVHNHSTIKAHHSSIVNL